MERLQLRPMTPAEFDAYRARVIMFSAETQDGESLGLLWVGLDRPRRGDSWIYDIEINPEHRGKDYGRALLHAAEQEAARNGAKAIGLNVFGTNTVARHLYESSGYQATSLNIRKDLAAQ